MDRWHSLTEVKVWRCNLNHSPVALIIVAGDYQ